jgi:hypothetical protein
MTSTTRNEARIASNLRQIATLQSQKIEVANSWATRGYAKTAEMTEAISDMFTVSDYAEDMKNGQTFPPLSVVFDGEHYWLWDGFHRLAAHVKNEAKFVACEVRQGKVEEARWLALGANKNHGLRRTNADKRRAVEMALKSRPKMSDRAIAEHCGVSHQTVCNHREALSKVDSQPDTRTGRDGRTINVANIGKPSSAPPSESPTLPFAEDDDSDQDDEPTIEEWDAEPEEYLGYCCKECYANQTMTKGSVAEFGTRGVYVCDGCGYAYPPGCAPGEADENGDEDDGDDE